MLLARYLGILDDGGGRVVHYDHGMVTLKIDREGCRGEGGVDNIICSLSKPVFPSLDVHLCTCTCTLVQCTSNKRSIHPLRWSACSLQGSTLCHMQRPARPLRGSTLHHAKVHNTIARVNIASKLRTSIAWVNIAPRDGPPDLLMTQCKHDTHNEHAYTCSEHAMNVWTLAMIPPQKKSNMKPPLSLSFPPVPHGNCSRRP